MYLCVSICIYVCRHTHILFFFKATYYSAFFPFGKLTLQRRGNVSAGGGQKQSRDERWEKLEFWTVCVLEGWVCVALEREEKKKVGARRC